MVKPKPDHDLHLDSEGRFVLEMKAADADIAQDIRNALLLKGGESPFTAEMGSPYSARGYADSEEKQISEETLLANLHKLPPVLQSMIRLGHAPKFAIVLHNPGAWNVSGALWIAELHSTEQVPEYGTHHVWKPRWKLADEVGAQEHYGWEEIAEARGMTYMNSSSKAP